VAQAEDGRKHRVATIEWQILQQMEVSLIVHSTISMQKRGDIFSRLPIRTMLSPAAVPSGAHMVPVIEQLNDKDMEKTKKYKSKQDRTKETQRSFSNALLVWNDNLVSSSIVMPSVLRPIFFPKTIESLLHHQQKGAKTPKKEQHGRHTTEVD
jgi:hypothetical protein